MEIVAGMNPRIPMKDVADYARRIESLGFDSLHVPEMIHDPFVVSGLALAATTHLRVRTGVALAFVRSPMASALSSWGLSELSSGRFDLGLGSQIRQNIVERYSMPFGPPVSRLREYIAAIRSCFNSFMEGTDISFKGEFYQLTRLQREFLPDALTKGNEPDIWLGAVGEKMTALAGSVSDGLLTHPTNSHPLHLRNNVIPILESSLHYNSGDRIPVIVSPLTAIANDHDARKELVALKKKRLAFLYSTPAYDPSLKMLGFEDLGKRLRDLLPQKGSDIPEDEIPDKLFQQVAIECNWENLGEIIVEWFGDVANGVILRPPDETQFDQQFLTSLSTIRASA